MWGRNPRFCRLARQKMYNVLSIHDHYQNLSNVIGNLKPAHSLVAKGSVAQTKMGEPYCKDLNLIVCNLDLEVEDSNPHFSNDISGLYWWCISTPSLIAKGSKIQKICDEQTFRNGFNFKPYDLVESNPDSSKVTLSVNLMHHAVYQIWDGLTVQKIWTNIDFWGFHIHKTYIDF